MILWVDAQLSPHLAPWLRHHLAVDAYSMAKLGLRDAKDKEIFAAARSAGAVVLTKDRDFVLLLELLGPPPRVVWISCGNTSNAHLKSLLSATLPRALDLLVHGETLVEIRDSLGVR